MTRSSDSTEEETCAMGTRELTMSRRSLHRSNRPTRVGTVLEKMDVDVGEHDEQDEAGQREDLRRVPAARQP